MRERETEREREREISKKKSKKKSKTAAQRGIERRKAHKDTHTARCLHKQEMQKKIEEGHLLVTDNSAACFSLATPKVGLTFHLLESPGLEKKRPILTDSRKKNCPGRMRRRFPSEMEDAESGGQVGGVLFKWF